MRRCLPIFTLAFAVASFAAAAQPSPPAINPELKDVIVEFGVAARMSGECEHLANGGAGWGQFVSELGSLKLTGDPTADEKISAMLLKHYAEGRAEGPKAGHTQDQCRRAMVESRAKLDEAISRLNSARN